MADAVRLALEHNHQLRAKRLDVDLARTDEITAGLKPNPVLTSTNENFPVFAPSQLFSADNLVNNQNYVESFSYLFERGGKRENRLQVSKDTTSIAAQTTRDAERQLEFQTRQAFINVLLAKSARELANDNLKDFSSIVDVNRQRMTAGDLAEADFSRILLQQLQFEQDVAAAELALAQANAALRQSVGVDALSDNFEVDGELAYTKYSISLDELTRDALAARPDLLSARGGVTLARDTQNLERSNGTRDIVGGVEYDRAGPLNALGFSLSVDLPFHDRNQGNIARSAVALRQAGETEASAVSTVITDVLTAFAAFQTSEKVVALYQSGYLERAKESLDITTYVYQSGSGTLLDLLDAERTYRATQLAYRQALATYMTAVAQVNFAVGRQVMP
jgi:cobalt-zinc-cadmium efflux system outer membrane protein